MGYHDCDIYTRAHICAALWRGDTIAAIARELGVSKASVTAIREDEFARFQDPSAVKDAANGPLINPHTINRPKAKRKPRRSGPSQIDMFSV